MAKNFLRGLSSLLGTLTTNNPGLTITATWNATAVAFQGILVNITNTASAATSRLFDLQIGGTSKFSVDASGNVINAGGLTSAGTVVGAVVQAGTSVPGSLYVPGVFQTGFGSQSIGMGGATTLQWAAGAQQVNGGFDTGFSRVGVGLVQLNRAVNGTLGSLQTGGLTLGVTTVAAAVTLARHQCYVRWTGSTAYNVTLPSPVTTSTGAAGEPGCTYVLMNRSSVTQTVVATVDGTANPTVAPGGVLRVVSNGTDYDQI